MGKILALTIPSEEPSVARLGFDRRTYIYDTIETFSKNNPNTVIARFGNSVLPKKSNNPKDPKTEEYPYVLNNSRAIWLNCEKHNALKVMSKVVTTPKLYEKTVPRNKLVVVRPHAHSAGSGFKVVRGPVKLNKFEYAIDYINSPNEVRVWFCGDSVMTATRVSKRHAGEKFPCRSKWGYEFRKTPTKLKKDVLKAAKAIGLDFGAADIIIKTNKYYFLECNSSPTIDSLEITKFYREGIEKLAKKKFPHAFKKQKGALYRAMNFIKLNF